MIGAIKSYFFPKSVVQQDGFQRVGHPMQILIFSFLKECDANFAADVSKKWNLVINEHFYRPLCLTSKVDQSISWRAHYFTCKLLNRKIPKYEPEGTTLLTTYVPKGRMLLAKADSNFACFVYNSSPTMNTSKEEENDTQAGDYVFQIFDMQQATLVKKFECLQGEWISEIDFGYPHLLTVVGSANTILIRDVRNPDEQIRTLKMTGPMSSLCINRYGFSCLSYDQSWNNGKVVFGRIEQNKPLEISVVDRGITGTSFILLHQQQIIYGAKHGLLRVKDVTQKDFPLLGELSFPKRPLEASPKNNFEITSQDRIVSMYASDQLLLTWSKDQMFIWNLATFTIVRTFPLSNECDTQIVGVSGQTFFVNESHEIRAFDFRGALIKQWENPNLHASKRAICVYGGKVYILKRDEEQENSSLVVYDYEKTHLAKREKEEKVGVVFLTGSK